MGSPQYENVKAVEHLAMSWFFCTLTDQSVKFKPFLTCRTEYFKSIVWLTYIINIMALIWSKCALMRTHNSYLSEVDPKTVFGFTVFFNSSLMDAASRQVIEMVTFFGGGSSHKAKIYH